MLALIKKAVIWPGLLVLSGCCIPVFESYGRDDQTEWMGKNQMSQQAVFDVCKGRLTDTVEQLNHKYANMLPQACRSKDGFTAFDSLPMSVLVPNILHPDDDKKASYVANRISAAEKDCAALNNKKEDKWYQERLLSFYPYDKPSNFRYKHAYADSTSDLLCHLDADCRALQNKYWVEMEQCAYKEFELSLYVVQVESYCRGIHVGGTGGEKRVLQLRDYHKDPIKYCTLYPEKCKS